MKRTVIAIAMLGLVAAACGSGDPKPAAKAATQTVKVEMRDIAFSPASFSARQGERVRFVFENHGQIPHDAFIGDTAAQADHERMMRAGDGAKSDHHKGGDKDEGITVEPGKTKKLVFTRTGTVEIGCHQPGHYAAGMKVAVTVA